MQRTALGILAAALLVGALLFFLLLPSAPPFDLMRDVMLRFGIMFGIVWLAVPNFRVIFARIPPWLVAATFGAVAVLIRWPRTIVAVGPILIAMWALGVQWFKPRSK
jgi:hypothetical protein